MRLEAQSLAASTAQKSSRTVSYHGYAMMPPNVR